MSTQTRNKRKDWQAGLGIKAHKVVCQRPLSGLSVTVKWALGDQVSGIERPSNGQSLPVQRALSAQSIGWLLGTSCGSAAPLLCVMLYGDLWCFDGGFCDTSIKIMIHLWYFFVKYIESLIFVYCYVSDIYTRIQPKRWYFETFFTKKLFFVCV